MSIKMSVYYPQPEDADTFEKRYVEGHLPKVRKYDNMTHSSFHKVSRTILGDFPYGYVFTGTWDDFDGFREDMGSEAANEATEDAKEFASDFHVVVWEQLA